MQKSNFVSTSTFYFFLFYINFYAVILTIPDFLSAAD